MTKTNTAIGLVQELVAKRLLDGKKAAEEQENKQKEQQEKFEQVWRPVLDFLRDAAAAYPHNVWLDKSLTRFALEYPLGGFREIYELGELAHHDGRHLAIRRGRPHPTQVVMQAAEAGEFLPFLIDALTAEVVKVGGKR